MVKCSLKSDFTWLCVSNTKYHFFKAPNMIISSFPSSLVVSPLQPRYFTESPEQWHEFKIKSIYTVLFSSRSPCLPYNCHLEWDHPWLRWLQFFQSFQHLRCQSDSAQRWREHYSLICALQLHAECYRLGLKTLSPITIYDRPLVINSFCLWSSAPTH